MLENFARINIKRVEFLQVIKEFARIRLDSLLFNYKLFFPHEDVNRSTREVPLLADLILQIAAVWLLNPLWEIAEESERRDVWCGNNNFWILLVGGSSGRLKLGHIFDLDELTLVVWWWISTDNLLHILVEL